MEYEVITNFALYQKARSAVESVISKETTRRSLLQNALLLKTVLSQQLYIENSNHKESKDHSSVKQDLTKAQHEKKLLENKISMLNTEIDTWKKKSANQTSLQKETLSLKNQITKLNSQLNESRNEIGKVKQQFVTQKAVLESKLENAKKNIKNLKDKNTLSPSKALQPPSSILSPVKSQTKSLNNHQKLGLKRPLVSNFSTSPFLNKNLHKATSPSKDGKQQNNFQSPVPLNSQNLLATSTPGAPNAVSPLKDLKSRKPSGLKNLISPAKPPANGATKPNSKKKPSLFDDDDDDDEDIFGNSIRKLDATKNTPRQEPPSEEPKQDNEEQDTKKKQPAKRRRKIGGKAIVEDVDNEEEPKFSPLKKVKLLDKLGGISPLKQRNQERNLFKV